MVAVSHSAPHPFLLDKESTLSEPSFLTLAALFFSAGIEFNMTSDNERTSLRLLQGLHRNEEGAWRRFLNEYGPRILDWCRHWGLQEADADEVAGMVLLKLIRRMPHFEYDPAKKFRGWLKTVIDGQVMKWLAKTRCQPGGQGSGGTDAQEALEELPDRRAAEELECELEDMLQPEVKQAMDAVRGRVEATTWGAFMLTVVNGASGAEAASHLGITVTAAHVNKHRVAKMLREEIGRRLDPNRSLA